MTPLLAMLSVDPLPPFDAEGQALSDEIDARLRTDTESAPEWVGKISEDDFFAHLALQVPTPKPILTSWERVFLGESA